MEQKHIKIEGEIVRIKVAGASVRRRHCRRPRVSPFL